MITYILIFNIPLMLMYFEIRNKIIFEDLLKLYFLFLLVFIGLRYEVGGDFYSTSLSMLPLNSIYDVFSTITVLNSVLLYISKLSYLDVFLYNFIGSCVFIYSFYKFTKNLESRSLTLIISFPIIFLILSMGFTKQSYAFSFILLGIYYFKKEEYFKTILLFTISILFHISSIIILAIFLYKIKYMIQNIYTYIFLFFLIILSYFYLPVLNEYVLNWVLEDAKPKSAGIILRVLINIPVIFLYIIFRSKILNIDRNYAFLDIILAIQMIILVLAFSTNISGLLDRFNIILSFSQILVYSLILQINKDYFIEIFSYIYLKYFIILYFWLSFADTRIAWLPYKNILFSNF